MTRFATACAAALGALLLAGSGGAAAQQASSTDKSNLSRQDQDFLKEAAQAGLAEVELSKAVEDRVAQNDVKSFAQHMVDDHGKNNDQLKALVQRKGVSIPADLDAQHQSMKQRLGQLSGYELERRYVEGMLKDHEKAVALFEKETSRGRDEETKKFAQDTLPTLREHLASVRGLEQKLKKMQTSQH